MDTEFDDDHFVDDDDGNGYAKELITESQFEEYEEDQRKKYGGTSSAPYFSGNYEEAMEVQSSFQPGCTPYRKDRRYLAFDMNGVIYSINQSTHSTITIEFHDKSKKQHSITDNYTYCLAALGKVCLSTRV